MEKQTHSEPATLPPELPLGIGVAFLVMGLVCGVAPLEDRSILVGSCAAAGVVALAVAFLWKRQAAVADGAHAAGPGHPAV